MSLLSSNLVTSQLGGRTTNCSLNASTFTHSSWSLAWLQADACGRTVSGLFPFTGFQKCLGVLYYYSRFAKIVNSPRFVITINYLYTCKEALVSDDIRWFDGLTKHFGALCLAARASSSLHRFSKIMVVSTSAPSCSGLRLRTNENMAIEDKSKTGVSGSSNVVVPQNVETNKYLKVEMRWTDWKTVCRNLQSPETYWLELWK